MRGGRGGEGADTEDGSGGIGNAMRNEPGMFIFFKVVLFRCDWVDVYHNNGIRQDGIGITLVSFSCLVHTGEKLEHNPYEFSSQVEQVFYVQDPKNENWSKVIKTRPRGLFDMGV